MNIQKSLAKNAFYWVISSVVSFSSCTDMSDDENKCYKGKYIQRYCEGIVIEVLDKKNIGGEWKSINTGKTYKNVLAAYPDTLVQYTTNDPLNFKSDSVFYFKFKEGQIIRKQFILCETDVRAVIITYASPNPCM